MPRIGAEPYHIPVDTQATVSVAGGSSVELRRSRTASPFAVVAVGSSQVVTEPCFAVSTGAYSQFSIEDAPSAATAGSTPEVVANVAPGDDITAAVNTAVATLKAKWGWGQVILPPSATPYHINPVTVSGSTAQGIVLDDRVELDGSWSELKLVDDWQWPAALKANGSRKMHMISVVNPFTAGVSRTGVGLVRAIINGNAINQDDFGSTSYDPAIDGICNGVFFSRALAAYMRDVVLKNVPGHGTSPATGELFHASFNRCMEIRLGNVVVMSDDAGQTASGLGFDFCTGINIDASADKMGAMGVTFYACAGVRGRIRATRCLNGVNLERVTDFDLNVEAGGRSASGASLVATASPFVATDATLGNTTGVRLQGPSRGRLTGFSTFNTGDGLKIQSNTAEAPTLDAQDVDIDMVLTDNGGFGYGETAAAGTAHKNIRLAGSCVFARNTSGAMSKHSVATLGSAAPADLFTVGRYYFTLPSSGSGAAAATQDRLGVSRWSVKGKAIAIDRIGVEVSTAAAGATIRLGIYADTGGGLPGALIAELGTIDASTTGVKELALAGAALTAVSQLDPSDYWVGGVVQGSAAVQWRIPTNAMVAAGSTGLPGSASASTGYHTDGVNGALPASFPGPVASGSVPRTVVRIAA